MRAVRFLVFATSLALLTHGPARAQTNYDIQQIVRLGDRAADVQLAIADGYFEIGALDDNGRLAFIAQNAAGGEALIQFADGKLTPIVAAGKTAPGGSWPPDVQIIPPVHLNQVGNVVFAAGGFVQGKPEFNTFLWDFRTQKVTALARKGDVVGSGALLEQGGGAVPTINNSSEVALVAKVRSAAGSPRDGVFFVGRDRTVLPVALPDQVMPDGSRIIEAGCTTINNAGVIAFLARRVGDPDNAWSAYLWDAGTITPVAVVGASTPNGATIGTVWAVTVNDRNRNALVEAATGSPNGPNGIYWFTGGKLASVALPGQSMPGGGALKIMHGTSFANLVGQHAFWATLGDNSTAAYLLEPSGKLSLILKSGTSTPLGQITNVAQGAGLSHGIALNAAGQVAVTVRISAGSDTIVLLTPSSLGP